MNLKFSKLDEKKTSVKIKGTKFFSVLLFPTTLR